MKRVLITGAGSFIGTSFENYMRRFDDQYHIDTIDMLDSSWQKKDFSSYDTVFHVAGIAHSDNGKISEDKKHLYYSVNTELTIETAKKAKAEGVGQFIFMSSAIVYGNSASIGKSKMITKDTPVAPNNVYSDSKVQAENGLAELMDEGFKVVILRPPMIYGKNCKGNYNMLAGIAKKLPIFPYVQNQRSMLYIENLTEFVRLMIENNEQGIFWPQNAEYTTTADMVKLIAEVNGKKLFLIKGFGWLLKLLSHATGLVNKAFGSLTYDFEMSEYMGYQKYSLKESIKETER